MMNKFSKREWSQDGKQGGCGVHVSAQLRKLPGARGGPWTPKGMGETQVTG